VKALLLDTRALLWSVGDPHQLSPSAHAVLSAGVVPAYVSAASVWEIAIKRASGKLEVPDDLLEKVAAAGVRRAECHLRARDARWNAAATPR
jgi:PIN domain nuclease of toxin-antitoxin system